MIPRMRRPAYEPADRPRASGSGGLRTYYRAITGRIDMLGLFLVVLQALEAMKRIFFEYCAVIEREDTLVPHISMRAWALRAGDDTVGHILEIGR
ncbi:hypothetical protein AG1IA_06220 [Rhizoctonia solani AG-1 IA]|uniref:Uncharacterized protein n=1 Tax=Thanatephorus cucumeris (strain AG1-IA) TaxID=983506 RepID=L8WTS7_THACA|nr:hypothetical protein AG1IA_06220 [Rhizoctonia solani AG-1 IA]